MSSNGGIDLGLQRLQKDRRRTLNNKFCDVEEEFLDQYGLGRTMLAGGIAGMMEHLCMFPVDMVKTRMQTQYLPGVPQYDGILHALRTITRTEGPRALYRGCSAVVLAAIPSHAMYFATYEVMKERLGGNSPGYHVVATGLAGGCATMVHDAISTPLDLIKQRVQVFGNGYNGVAHCARHIVANEGARALWASYPTTVVMNVPFQAVHFATYESVKTLLSGPDGEHGVREECLAGGVAGAMGGFISTPLDVIKTRIQTQGVFTAITHQMQKKQEKAVTSGKPLPYPFYKRKVRKMYAKGAIRTFKGIVRDEGMRGLFKGGTARVLYFMPSAAIVWTTYESIKRATGLT